LVTSSFNCGNFSSNALAVCSIDRSERIRHSPNEKRRRREENNLKPQIKTAGVFMPTEIEINIMTLSFLKPKH
jgi:hypothetical protein